MKKTLLMMTFVFCLCYSLQAAPCGVATLATYDALGFTCDIGSLTFSDFSYISSQSGGGFAPPDAGVTVTPKTTGPEIGFMFSASWLASSMQTADGNISYSVSCAPACITDVELDTFGGHQGTGSASAIEGSLSPAFSLFSSDTGSDTKTFLAPVGMLNLTKDIGASGGTDGAGHISLVNNFFSLTGTPPPPTPEPSLLFLCLGLCALLPVARRRFGSGV